MKSKKQTDWNYEEKVAEIEAILDRLESGELSLEEVFEEFEVAAKHLKECDRFLERGRQRIELAIEVLKDEE
ncbi:exodeoxyribonuclease VII small subunit [Oscillatoria sp. FACHB-1406]|uniref:exodeoxyribonuclease VII small subunit n=1 Tax=Oscillatoria sp. FACHB-1406 TaxID=2692846 RepID=UPI001681F85C|nr:exodeoxyribonuclease VII small subunit [Oscillatoria sp. FACHB-1406]MBD2579143.1 exodeoxyribonuclease VII small subunit [Oscillatoria sp. FACHB-1406]